MRKVKLIVGLVSVLSLSITVLGDNQISSDNNNIQQKVNLLHDMAHQELTQQSPANNNSAVDPVDGYTDSVENVSDSYQQGLKEMNDIAKSSDADISSNQLSNDKYVNEYKPEHMDYNDKYVNTYTRNSKDDILQSQKQNINQNLQIPNNTLNQNRQPRRTTPSLQPKKNKPTDGYIETLPATNTTSESIDSLQDRLNKIN